MSGPQQRALLLASLFAASVLAAGCIVDIPLTDRPCAGDDDCLSDSACVAETCVERVACEINADCPDARICGDGACREPADGGVPRADAGVPTDSGSPDAGQLDGGQLDGGQLDSGLPDAGPPVIDGGVLCHGATVEVCAPAAFVRRVCESAVGDCHPALHFDSADDAFDSLIDAGVTDGYLFLYGGRYFLEADVIDDETLTIVGEDGAALYGGGSHIIDVKDSAHVTVRGVELSGDDDGDGVRDTSAYPARVQDSATLIIEDCQLGPSQRRGVLAENESTLEIRRSFVFDNDSGGIDVQENARVIIENCLIVDNGNGGGSGSNLGNVDLSGPAGTALFRHNTVLSGNRKRSDQTGGVICGDPQDIYASIIRSNTGYEVSGADCVLHASNVQGHGDDAGILDADPLLDGDYHLTAGSPCIDTATENTDVDFPDEPSPTLDFDGEPRPSGGGYDIGHDELQ